MIYFTRRFFALFSILLLTSAAISQVRSPRVEYISYNEARPILEVLSDELPTGLQGLTGAQLKAAWPGWVRRSDAEIRSRLARGDEDSVVNFLAFGTSFTREPRVMKGLADAGAGASNSGGPASAASEAAALNARVDDLIKALETPQKSERVAFVLRVLETKKINISTPEGKAGAKNFLLESFRRALSEQEAHARKAESARQLGDPTQEFVENSTVFQDRGLSLDTSILPDFAIEQSLMAMMKRGVLSRGSVRRVAVIGPGLDFTDKIDGYDFYPQQTIQPFAVIDTLLRLGLSRQDGIELTTLDISPRVNDHLARARVRAESGTGYTIQLPRKSDSAWKDETLHYWQQFGDQIGTPAKPVPVPANLGELTVRAVQVRPAVVLRVKPMDMNAVLQKLSAPGEQQFDLVIATNVFLYYDVFQQCLALANVGSMVRPGGFLLTNTALLEWPDSPMRAVDNLSIGYSNRGEGDHFVWYRRQ